MNAAGCSLGTTFAPNRTDWPMFYHGNPEPTAPGQVFFIYIITSDSEQSLAMVQRPDGPGGRTWGRSLVKTPAGSGVR
jgi:hypothetical protein